MKKTLRLAAVLSLGSFGALAQDAAEPAAATPVIPSVAPAAAEAAAADSDAEALDLVKLFKLGNELKVVSASQVAEPIREAPVPVTIITAEMIEQSGARNLGELLTLYVPSMTRAEDQNELQVAMRGVYGSSQQKMLIMLDGHRLNNRAYSSANTDFGIALNQLKRIEVLRGPGSSLYGNVALTAVINLVTYDGGDVQGARARVNIGDYGQLGASVVAGNEFGKYGDVLAWGSYYQSAGQRIRLYADPVAAGVDPRLQNYSGTLQDGEAIVGANRDPGSYNFGLKYTLGDFRLLFNQRYGKYTPALSDSGTTGEVYRFNDQTRRSLFGTGPGLAQGNTHGELAWSHGFGDRKQLSLSATAYYDRSEVFGLSITNPNGGAIGIGWHDQNVGLLLQGGYDYQLGAFGSGRLIAGFQWEYMQLTDSLFVAAADTVWTGWNDKTAPLLEPGREIIYSGFLMLRHRLFDAVVINLGGRYDEKFRKEGENVRNFSPRLSAVFAPKDSFWDVKLSYSQSFVDAPYWYRYNSLASYRGARNLTPEEMRSVQLSGSVSLLDDRLKGTLNFFYNDLFNIVFRNNNALPTEPIYQNAGFLRSVGAELEASWVDSWLHVRLVSSLQRAVESDRYGVSGPFINNVPPFAGALTVDVAPVKAWTQYLWLHADARFATTQRSPINLTFKDSMGNVLASWVQPNREVQGSVLVDVGVRVKNLPVRGVFLQATVYNLFDTYTEQGGATVHPYPQAGRWFLGTIGYDFDL